MNATRKDGTFLTTAEAAKQMGKKVTVTTVQKMCQDDLLVGAVQDSENGPWHIPESAVSDWIQKQNEKILLRHLMALLTVIGGSIVIVATALGLFTDMWNIGEIVQNYTATDTPIPTIALVTPTTPTPTVSVNCFL